jgi:putative chitinase
MVTDSELAAIVPTLPAKRRAQILPLLQASMRRFGITTRLREAAFLAQLAHESKGLSDLEEDASGKAYEGRVDLGNIHGGDGPHYKGRGFIMITGRDNYRIYGRLLGYKLEQQPELASQPKIAADIAGAFWS